MTLVQFLTATGAFTWMFLAWQSVRHLRDFGKRLQWAVYKYRNPVPWNKKRYRPRMSDLVEFLADEPRGLYRN